MKFKLCFLFLLLATISYGQMAELVLDLMPGPDSGISEEATVLGTLGNSIIINNQSDIVFSDGTAQGTSLIYTLNESEIVPGEVYLNNELYLSEYLSSDTSRILKINNAGDVETVLELAGAIELFVGYKDQLYYNRRFDFTEFLFSMDPSNGESEEIIELDWFKRSGFKDAIVFKDLMYMIAWPETTSGSFLARYDGEGDVELVAELFDSSVDQSSKATINMTAAGENLFFWYGDGTNDGSLYVTDGTEAGTLILNTDFDRRARTESLRTIGVLGNKILFEGVDSNNDRHLWSSDGTVAGTFIIEQVADIDITPRYFTEYKDSLAFCGYHGSQPFSAPDISTLVSDGTIAGTSTLLDRDDFEDGPLDNGHWLTNHNGELFMVGQRISFPFNNDLYKSDGTPQGTSKVSSIGEESGNEISDLTSANNNLFFFGTTDNLGKELYVYNAITDLDGDGFTSDVDCDDNNASVNPDQTEEPYNGIDDDCDPSTLDDDLDQDGFNLAEDCDDEDENINPAAEEIPDNDIDENCDGLIETTSIYELANSTINIYPNPVSESINIKVEGSLKYFVSIYSMNGKLIYHSQNKESININTLSNGTYLLEIQDQNSNEKITEKVIVSH